MTAGVDVPIALTFTDQVEGVNVHVGQHVRKGQTLLTVTPQPLPARTAQLQAHLQHEEFDLTHLQESQAGNYAIALNAQTGALIWADALPNGGDWATPLVANGDVFFPMANREGVSGGMIAFNALTGVQLWQDNNHDEVWAPPTLDPGGQYY